MSVVDMMLVKSMTSRSWKVQLHLSRSVPHVPLRKHHRDMTTTTTDYCSEREHAQPASAMVRGEQGGSEMASDIRLERRYMKHTHDSNTPVPALQSRRGRI